MKSRSKEFIFYNKEKLSIKKEDAFQLLSSEEKQKEFESLQNEIAKKDKTRRICTRTIFTILCIGAIAYGIFGKPNGNFWFYLFLIVFVLSWALLYLIFGLIFYKSIIINWHFKDIKSPLDDKCVTYYSSHYRVYVQKYEKFLGNVYFTYTPNAKRRKKKMVGFALVMPKRKRFIFNGKIESNIPYFAFYMTHGKKLFFFPGMIIYLNGKDTKVMSHEDFKVIIDESDSLSFSYLKTQLLYKNQEIATFYISNNFNKNFFNFKF